MFLSVGTACKTPGQDRKLINTCNPPAPTYTTYMGYIVALQRLGEGEVWASLLRLWHNNPAPDKWNKMDVCIEMRVMNEHHS